MMKELVIKIYESEQCGFKYDIYDSEKEDADSLDGGHCTSDLVNALEMATAQAIDIATRDKNEEHKKDYQKYLALSLDHREEVDQRISDQRQGDRDAKEAGGDYWEGTQEQYLHWALEEFEENQAMDK